jgi:hypothetical protein
MDFVVLLAFLEGLDVSLQGLVLVSEPFELFGGGRAE